MGNQNQIPLLVDISKIKLTDIDAQNKFLECVYSDPEENIECIDKKKLVCAFESTRLTNYVARQQIISNIFKTIFKNRQVEYLGNIEY